MTADRDALIDLLSYLPKHREIDSDDIAEAADAILAAGWTRPAEAPTLAVDNPPPGAITDDTWGYWAPHGTARFAYQNDDGTWPDRPDTDGPPVHWMPQFVPATK